MGCVRARRLSFLVYMQMSFHSLGHLKLSQLFSGEVQLGREGLVEVKGTYLSTCSPIPAWCLA